MCIYGMFAIPYPGAIAQGLCLDFVVVRITSSKHLNAPSINANTLARDSVLSLNGGTGCKYQSQCHYDAVDECVLHRTERIISRRL